MWKKKSLKRSAKDTDLTLFDAKTTEDTPPIPEPTPKPNPTQKGRGSKAYRLDDFILSLVSFVGVTESGLIRYLDGRYAAVVQIPGIDIENYTEEDRNSKFYAFATAILQSTDNIKIIVMDTPPDYRTQIEDLRWRMDLTDNRYLNYILERQILYLEAFAERDRLRSNFILCFGETEQEVLSGARAWEQLRDSNRGGGIYRLNKVDTLRFLNTLHHFGD